jgi:DNA-binding response OmpR family regulator
VPSLLLVDDDRPLLRALARYLGDHGYDVVACDSFEAGKQAILETRPDVLVTDIRLGAFNGLQLAMLGRDVNPQARIVVFSGYEDPVLQEDTRRIGASYLVKPVSGPDLLLVLRAPSETH